MPLVTATLRPPRDLGFSRAVLDEAHLPADRDLWSVGRSAKVKRKLVETITAGVACVTGVDPDNVTIVFVETAWENWSFAGGRLLHA